MIKAWLRNTLKNVLQSGILSVRFIWRLPRRSGAVCLTFDDGPHPDYTPKMLELLDRLNVKAVFFLIGENVEKYPGIVQEIASKGHQVAAHSMHHEEMPSMSKGDMLEDMANAKIAIQRACGVDTYLFRPPRGKLSAIVLWRLLKSPYVLVHWARTFSDYLQDGTEPLLKRIERSGIEAGDILLFHDTNPYTIEALEQAIPQWQGQGIRFELLRG